MSTLSHSNGKYLYSSESLLDNDDWGYLFSYGFHQPGHYEENEKNDFRTMSKEIDEKNKSYQASEQEIDANIEGLLNIKKDAFLKMKREKRESWERKIAQFCSQMKFSSESYYARKAATFFEIVVLCSDSDRNVADLFGNAKLTNPIMEEIAFASSIFPTLPGTNPENWPESLPELYKRVSELKPLTLWEEPFDETYQFQENCYKFIETMAEKYQKNPEKSAEIKENLRLALLTILTICLNSGSYERIVFFRSKSLKIKR